MSASNANDSGNETVFHGDRLLATPCRGVAEERLERYKQQLLKPILASVENQALMDELRAVANEAAALAWYTVCPVLVLPALLEEKTRMALKHWERQQRLRRNQNAGATVPATA